MKIAVYAIAKDEQANVNQFVDTARDADCVIVGVDDGDTTGDLLLAKGATVHRISGHPFRFDTYRNIVLERIPSDVDVCVSLDLDETLCEDWRQIIEASWKPGTTRLHYHLKSQDGLDERLFYDRIHARQGYEWRHASQEAIYPLYGSEERVVDCGLVVTNHSELKNGSSKNIGLLTISVNEDIEDPRGWWYLAREQLMIGNYEAAISSFRTYFILQPKRSIEKCWAAIFTSRCYHSLDMLVEKEAWLYAAIGMCQDSRDGHFEMAMHLTEKKKWGEAMSFIKSALNIDTNVHSFVHSSGAHTEEIYLQKAYLHTRMGEGMNAVRSYRKALRINPESEEARLGLA
tara:strand:- start:1156 stop:2190 length:1035 start_codon:yes stop_codon:yes gene_type:complete